MNAGVLIFFALVGMVICAKSRVPGGAVVFALIALALFVNTPVGSGLPGMLGDFLAAVGKSAEPFTATSNGGAAG
ncbi:MAG: hypothetical protein L0H84_12045 [Pseudonocardia sp.]|nr:hypothetical protein [Pseudonocardia sp.]